MKITRDSALNGCLVSIVCAILAVVAVGAYIPYSFKKSLEPVTDISRYAKIKSQWSSDLVTHFPPNAPASASFYFQTGFAQVGSFLQLKVVMSENEILSELQKFEKAALVPAENEKADAHQQSSTKLPAPAFLTDGKEILEFPEDYQIIFLHAQDNGGNRRWNHGSTAGVAVSKQRKTIVYWADDW
jgi:hypothetical protein